MPEEGTVPPFPAEPDAESGEPLAGSGFEDETPDAEYDNGDAEEEAQ
jgi:hypothetical protein